jgi:hypothetical protein
VTHHEDHSNTEDCQSRPDNSEKPHCLAGHPRPSNFAPAYRENEPDKREANVDEKRLTFSIRDHILFLLPCCFALSVSSRQFSVGSLFVVEKG